MFEWIIGPSQPPNGLRFTCAAKRSGAASGGSACWAVLALYYRLHPSLRCPSPTLAVLDERVARSACWVTSLD